MNANEIMAKIQELIGEGNIEQAQALFEENKEALGGYVDQAKELLADPDTLNNVIEQAKGFLGEENVAGILDSIKGFLGK